MDRERAVKSARVIQNGWLQKNTAGFASLRPDDFGCDVVAALQSHNYRLADYNILSIVEGFVGPQPEPPDGNVGYDDGHLVAIRRD